MKYIRTKEYGICKVISEDKHALSYENSYVVGCLWKESYKDKIQYANTIEELCDEFVWKAPNNHPLIVPNIYNVDIEKEIKNGRIIYGAIWTDKGLIYVAKMNEQGELELL